VSKTADDSAGHQQYGMTIVMRRSTIFARKSAMG